MAFEQRDNSGALFINGRKEKDTQPDFNGSVLVGGVEYWIAGWKKESGNGDHYMSLAFTEKESAPVKKPNAPVKKTNKRPTPF